MSTCQGLSQCVNALGRHDRRCPAAPVTAVDVDALDKLREAATAGPWVHRGSDGTGWRTLAGASGHCPAVTPLAADAALIVAAVNALPELLAEVRRGRALREAVEGLAEELDAPIVDGPCAGQRPLYGGGDVAYRIHRVVAAVDGGEQ